MSNKVTIVCIDTECSYNVPGNSCIHPEACIQHICNTTICSSKDMSYASRILKLKKGLCLYMFKLDSFDFNKLKVLRNITSLGLLECKDLLNNTLHCNETLFMVDVTQDKVEKIAGDLNEVGINIFVRYE